MKDTKLSFLEWTELTFRETTRKQELIEELQIELMKSIALMELVPDCFDHDTKPRSQWKLVPTRGVHNSPLIVVDLHLTVTTGDGKEHKFTHFEVDEFLWPEIDKYKYVVNDRKPRKDFLKVVK